MIILAKKSMCPVTFCTGPNPPINIGRPLSSGESKHYSSWLKKNLRKDMKTYELSENLLRCDIMMYDHVRELFFLSGLVHTVKMQNIQPTFVSPSRRPWKTSVLIGFNLASYNIDYIIYENVDSPLS